MLKAWAVGINKLERLKKEIKMIISDSPLSPRVSGWETKQTKKKIQKPDFN